MSWTLEIILPIVKEKSKNDLVVSTVKEMESLTLNPAKSQTAIFDELFIRIKISKLIDKVTK